MYTYIAELPLLLDTVFLIPFEWVSIHGVFMIFCVSIADIDRFITIAATYKGVTSGNWEEAVSDFLWWKALKLPVGVLLAWIHSNFLLDFWSILSSVDQIPRRQTRLYGITQTVFTSKSVLNVYGDEKVFLPPDHKKTVAEHEEDRPLEDIGKIG